MSDLDRPDDDRFIAILRTDWQAFQKDLAEAQRREELMRPVVEKAQTWKKARADQQGSGMAFHRACSALAGALDTYETQTGGTE